MKCQYRIVVSIDGGGVRGIVPLKILKTIQESAHRLDPTLDLSSFVDVFSGSSTGSIIAGALMLQNQKGKSIYTPSSLYDFYLDRGAKIFDTKNQSNVVARYSLKFLIDHFFNLIKVEDVKKHFLYVSYDLNADEQFLFTDTMYHLHRNLTVAQIMQGCSAMPGICPPLELGNSLLVDGMIATKNPSVLAYNYAKKLYPDDPIILLSLGTGKSDEDEYDAFEQEIKRVDDNLYFDGKKSKDLIYFRFQPKISSVSNDVDDKFSKNIYHLIDDTDQYLKTHQPKLDRLISLIKIKAGIL